jgi:hypothetical protein
MIAGLRVVRSETTEILRFAQDDPAMRTTGPVVPTKTRLVNIRVYSWLNYLWLRWSVGLVAQRGMS